MPLKVSLPHLGLPRTQGLRGRRLLPALQATRGRGSRRPSLGVQLPGRLGPFTFQALLCLASCLTPSSFSTSEYLLNPMEQRLGTHTAPRGAPPARKEAGRAQGGACRLSSEVSETACSLRRSSERRKPMTTSGVVRGPGHGRARTPQALGQAHRCRGPGKPARPPPRGPCVQPGRGAEGPRRSVLTPGGMSGSQHREDGRGVSVLSCKARRGTHGHLFSCKAGRKGDGKKKTGKDARRSRAPSTQRRKMEKTRCTWNALSTLILRGRRNHPVLKCEVGNIPSIAICACTC